MGIIKSINIPLVAEQQEYYIEAFDETIDLIISWIIDEQSSNLINTWAKVTFDRDLSSTILDYIDSLNSTYNRMSLLKTVQERLIGYGELQKYIEDEAISDILGSRFDSFYVKKNGKLEKIDVRFQSEEIFQSYCRLLVLRNGGVINQSESHERVSDLRYKLRINVTLPPQSVMGASLCIRKHNHSKSNFDDLLVEKLLCSSSLEIMNKITASKRNVVIFGRGGAGKTTLLRAMLNKMNENERILVVETDPELYPNRPNVIVHRVQKGMNKSASLQKLIKDGLTMSLDTYVIGEIVGEEAYDFIQAGLTDHRVIGTLHANDYQDCILRLCSLMSTVTSINSDLIIKMIKKTVDCYVYMSEYSVCEIHERKVDEEGEISFSLMYRKQDYVD